MKTACALVLAAVGATAQASLIGYFDFNDTLDPTHAANADVKALEFVQGTVNPASAGTPFFSTAQVGGTTKRVAQFGLTQGFKANHGIPSNGGGSYGNVYSILFDIKTTERSGHSGWMSLYQTSAANNNDGDAFIQNNGVGISGVYNGGWTDNVWTRLVLTVDLTADDSAGNERMKVYRDGTLINSIALGAGVDGRWALYTTQDGDPAGDHMWIFMDEDSDHGAGYVSALAWWDTALSAQEVAALGGAGEAVPEPFTLAALSGLAALTLRRKKA